MAASAWTCPVMLRAWLLGTTALLPAAVGALAQGIVPGVAPNALPTGGQVVAGQAAISQSGTAMQVRQGSDRAAINWQGFNIGANASVNFQQPNATSWTLNRVTGPDPSVIAGRMTANGGVAIVNQSGMVFAQGAQVNVGSLIASAANVTNENFMAGRMVFDGAPKPGARVENHGSITVADRGLAALVGPRVGNTGTIRARLGRVALAGAETYSLDLAGDGLLSIDVTQAVRTAPGGATALVTNSGVIEAQGGAVLITAHAASGLVEDLVRNTGRISADAAAGRSGEVALRAEGGGVRVDGQVTARGGAGERGGRIELRGGSATTVGATARISASGGAGGGTVLVGTTGVGRNQAMSARTTVEAGARIRANARDSGHGGTIAVNSTTETMARGSYAVRGGAQGGNGGLVELSGQRGLGIAAQVDAAAPKGQRGALLIDPTSIQIVADDNPDAPATPGAPLGSVTATTTPDGVLLVRASDLSTVAATVTLEARHDITIGTAVNIGANTLNLFANDAIAQAAGATITAGMLVIRGADGDGAAGSAVLDASNAVGRLDAKVTGVLSFDNGGTELAVLRATGGSVTLKTTAGIAVQGDVGSAGGTVVFNVDGAVSQSAGVVAGATLTVAGRNTAAPLSIDLKGANAVGTVDLQSGGSIDFSNAAAGLTVSRATTSGNGAAVTLGSGGGGLTLAGEVGGAGSGAVGVTGAEVTLAAAGDILQAGGTISGRSVSATGGTVRLDSVGNRIARLTATASGGVTVESGVAMSVLAGGVTAGTGSSIALVAPELSIDGQLGFAGPSAANSVALTADAISATAGINTGGSGNVSLAPLLATDIDIGGSTPGALLVSQALIDRMTAATLRMQTGTGRIVVNADLGFANSLDLLAATDIAQAGGTTISAGRLGLRSTGGGAISQGTGAAIAAAELTVQAGPGGSITLDGANSVGSFGTLGADVPGTLSFTNAGSADLTVTRASANTVTLKAGGAMILAGVVGATGSSVTLQANGAITQPSGAITAASLTIRGFSGGAARAASATLAGSNGIGTLDAAVTNGLLLNNGLDALAVARALGSTVTLRTGGALDLQGLVGGAGATVVLNASGAITQSGGTVTADALTIHDASGIAGTAAASVALHQPNAVGALDAAAAGRLSVTNGSAGLAVTQAVAGGEVTLTTGGALALQGPVSGTAVALNAGGAISQAAGAVTASTLTIRGAAGGTSRAASASLGQANAVGTLDARVVNGLLFGNGANSLAVAQAVGGAVTLVTAGALELQGAVGQAGAAVALNVTGAVTQAGGAVIADSLVVRDAAGVAAAESIALDQTNSVGSLDARAANALRFDNGLNDLTVTEASGSGVRLATGGALTLQGIVGRTGGTVALHADGPILEAVTGRVVAGALAIRGKNGSGAAGAVLLDQGNSITTLDVLSSGSVAVRSGEAPLTVSQARLTGSGAVVQLSSDGTMTLTGAVGGTAASVFLLTAQGGILQTGGAVTAASLAAMAGAGAISLESAGNRVGGVTASAAGNGHGVAIRSDVVMSILAGGIEAGKGSAIALTGPGLAIDNGLGFAGADAANRILLATDALTATAAIDAGTAGQVRIAAITGGIDIGGAAADALLLSTATLGRVAADRLVLVANGDLRLGTALALTPTLELIPAGGITQDAAAALSVARLSATANGGGISLTGANSIGIVTGSSAAAAVGMSAAGDVAFTNVGLLANEASILAGIGRTITLRADDLAVGAVIGAGSGSLAALNLLPRTTRAVTLGAADAGAFALDGAEIERLRPGPAGTLRIGSDGGTTTATTMVVAGDVAPGSAAILDLQAQRVSQTGGVVTAAAVTGRAVDDFALDRVDGGGAAVNQIDAVGAAGIRVSGGSIALLSARSLTTRGDVVAEGAAGAASVRLRGAGLGIGEVASPVLVQAGNGDLVLEGGVPGVSVQAGSVVRAGDTSGLHGDILVSGGSVALAGSLDTLSLAGGRDISVASTGSMVVQGQAIAARRDLILDAGGSYQVGSAPSAGRDALLSAGSIVGIDASGGVVAGRDAILVGSGSSVLAGNLTAGRSARVTSGSGNINVGAGVTVAAGADTAADASAELRLVGALTIGNAGSLVSNGRPVFVTSTGSLINNSGMIDSRGSGTQGAITLAAATQIFNGASGVIRGGVVTLGAQSLVAQSGVIDGTDVAVTVGSVGATGVTGFTAASGSSITASGMLTVAALAGGIAATGATLQADGAMVVRADAGGIALTGGTVSGAGTVLLQAGGDIGQVGVLVSAGTALQLKAAGAIMQGAGARIVAPVLSGTAGGSVTLLNGIALPGALAARALGNDIGRIDGFAAGGDFVLASTVTLLRISQPVSAGAGRELRLFADDFALGVELAAPGGTVSLSPYRRDGGVALVLGGVGGASAENAVTLDSMELGLLPVGATARLRLGRVDTPDGGSDFGGVAIAGPVDLADRVGQLELHARGAILQQAGTRLVVPVLAATAGGDILLDPGDGANRIGQLAGIVSEGGDFRLRAGLAGAAVVLRGGSAVAGDAGAGPDAILVGRSVPGGGKTVTLQVDDLDIQGAVRAPGGTIEIAPHTAGRPVALGGATLGGASTLRLTADELAQLGGGAGPSGPAAQVLRIGRLAGQPAAGTALISVLGDLTLQGATAQVQALELFSAGAIQGSGGAITVPALRAAAVGDVRLDNAGNRFLVNAVSGADVAIAQAGDLRLANAVASIGGADAPGGVTATGTLSLTAGGTIGQDSGALIQAGTLRLQAGGPVTLGERNSFDTLAAATIGGTGASLVRGFGYSVAGPVTTTGSLKLVATDFGNLAVTGSIHADGDLSLATEAGQATVPGVPPYGQIAVSGSLSAGGALGLATDMGRIVLTGATLQSGGAMTLATGALNQVGLAGIQIGGSSLTAGGALGVTAGLFAAAGQDSPVAITGSTIGAGGGLSLVSGAGLAVGDSGLTAGGSQVWQAGAGAMAVSNATAMAGTGFTLRADQDIGITGSGLAATTGAMTVTAGLVNAGAVSIVGSGLTAGTGLGITAARGFAATGTGLAAQDGALGIVANGGGIALDSTDVTASGALTLTATGMVGQRRGSLVGGSVAVQAGQGISATADGGASPLLRATMGNLTLGTTSGDIGLTDATLTAATNLGLTATAGGVGITGSALTATGGALGAQATGAMAIGGSGLVAGQGVALAAALDIGVTGSTLTAQGGALAVGSATRGIVLDTSDASASGALTLTAAGAVGHRRGSLLGGSVAVQAGQGINVTSDGGASPLLRSTAGALTLMTSGDIGLAGATLTAATDLVLAATAGGIGIGGSSLVAGLGGSVSAGGSIGLAGSTLAAQGGGLGLTAALGDLGFDTSGVSARGALTLSATRGRIGQRGGSLAGATLTAQAGLGITVADDGGAAPSLGTTAGALSLASLTGDVRITGAALDAATDLGLAASGGPVFLARATARAGGALDLAATAGFGLSDAAVQAGGMLTARATNGDAVVLRSSLTAGLGQALTAERMVQATNATLIAQGGDLAVTARTGSLGLAAVTGSASGAVTLASGGAMDIAGSNILAGLGQGITAQGGLTVTGTSLAAQGGSLALAAIAGDIGLDGSTLSAGGALGLTAGGGISQRRGSLSGASLTGLAGNGIAVTADGGAGPQLIATTGALGLTAGAGDIALTGAVLAAAGDLGLVARTGALAVTGGSLTAQGGTLAGSARGGIALSSTMLQAAGALGLTADGGLQASATTVTAGGAMSLAAGGTLNLSGSGLTARGGDIGVAVGGDAGLASSTLLASDGVSLAGGGGFTASAAQVTAGAGMALSTRLAASLIDSSLAAGGSLSLVSGAGGVTVTRGGITGGGDATLRGAGEVLVTDAGSGSRPVLRSTGGMLTLRSDNAGVTLRNVVGSGAAGLGLAAGGGISLTDTALTTPGRLAAAGSGSLAVLRSGLASTAGDIDMTAGGAATIGASTLRASRQLRVVAGGGMTLSGLTLDADTGDFEAGRPNPAAYGSTNGSEMTTDGVTGSIGTALLFAAPGGITNLGPTLVTPRGTPLPAVLFDTRLAPGANPLTIVRPDIAGTPDNQQPTQVRSAPGSQGPGAFGLPDQATAAGAVALNLNAGQSAVFLLVDGGAVSGTVAAGRLAVHGTGGGATLSGTLGGSTGAEAARFADITRPIDANSLQRYRFNSCVIGSINCVVPPSIQIIPPRPTDQARFTIENNRINLSDVLIPNVGEEDEE